MSLAVRKNGKAFLILIDRNMKIKSNYKLREIAGETIVVNQGTTGVDMTRIISFNQSARMLYLELVDKDFTLEDVVSIMMDRFVITREMATKDASKWIDILIRCGIIEC